MEELENKDQEKVVREEIFSKTVRAGKRTYFFDVKATRAGEQYLTITESKRRFNNEQGKFYYEKHKLFLYKEDFEKFANGLTGTLQFIQTGEAPEEEPVPEVVKKTETDPLVDVEFEDLGSDTVSDDKEESKD